jgi:hypothetical protein
MRERIAELSTMSGEAEVNQEATTAPVPDDEKAVDDDLARRLERLSKK